MRAGRYGERTRVFVDTPVANLSSFREEGVVEHVAEGDEPDFGATKTKKTGMCHSLGVLEEGK